MIWKRIMRMSKSERTTKQEAEAAEKKKNSKQAPYICEGLFHIVYRLAYSEKRR